MRKIICLLTALFLSLVSFSVYAEDGCTEVMNSAGQVTKRTCANDITTYTYSTKNGETTVTMTKYAKTPKGKQGNTIDYLKTVYNADETVKSTESRSYNDAGTRVGGVITEYENGRVKKKKNEEYHQGRILSENTITKGRNDSGALVQTGSNEKTYEYNPSGSYQVYENGKLLGRYSKNGSEIVSKKIYTIQEAEALSKENGNKVRLRYR